MTFFYLLTIIYGHDQFSDANYCNKLICLIAHHNINNSHLIDSRGFKFKIRAIIKIYYSYLIKFKYEFSFNMKLKKLNKYLHIFILKSLFTQNSALV